MVQLGARRPRRPRRPRDPHPSAHRSGAVAAGPGPVRWPARARRWPPRSAARRRAGACDRPAVRAAAPGRGAGRGPPGRRSRRRPPASTPPEHGQVDTPSWADEHGAVTWRRRRRGRAAPQRDHRLDGLGHPLGHPGRRQRTEVERAVVPGHPHHRQAGERLVEGELEVGVALPGGALAVEAGLVLVDEAHLADRGLERGGAPEVVDGLRSRGAAGRPSAGCRPRSRSGPACAGCWPCRRRAPGRRGRGTGRRPGTAGSELVSESLVACAWPTMVGSVSRSSRPVTPEAGGPLEQHVQQVGGGERVVEGPVAGLVVEAQVRRERAELAVGDLVAHEPAGEGERVDRAVASGAAARCGPARPAGSRCRSARCGRR